MKNKKQKLIKKWCIMMHDIITAATHGNE